MKLCEDCLRQCAQELLPNDIAVLYALDGYDSFMNGATRSDIYALVQTMGATQINEILRKLEFVGLINSSSKKKNIIYYITNDGLRVMNTILDNTRNFQLKDK